jgi:predicted RNA-binding Zn-ribbon protein involved in translation (DUF1610 family)
MYYDLKKAIVACPRCGTKPIVRCGIALAHVDSIFETG